MPLLILLVFLFGIGFLLSFVGGVWTLFLAFADHIGWGLAYLFLPFAGLVFIVLKWENKSVRKSFFLQIIGLLFLFLGAIGMTVTGAYIPDLKENTVTPSGSERSQDNAQTSSPDASSTTETVESESPRNTTQTSSPTASPTPATVETGSARNIPQASSPVVSTTAKSDYTQNMLIGYAAFEKKDYQTALTSFKKAVSERPGDSYAVKAISNTEELIKRSRQ